MPQETPELFAGFSIHEWKIIPIFIERTAARKCSANTIPMSVLEFDKNQLGMLEYSLRREILATNRA